ncbi:MAG: hypothetical protein JNL38_28605 [Myxococcales bacterium]|nr:hypothetical protein [Myxococcales bacterium]
MKRLGLGVGIVVVSLAAGAPAPAADPPPHIERVSPDVVVATSEIACSGTALGSVAIYGSNLAPFGTTSFSRDVQVYGRPPGGAWEQLRTSAWRYDYVDLGCLGAPYRQAGNIEIKLVRLGVTSNVATIRVVPRPTTPPRVSNMVPNTVPRGPGGVNVVLSVTNVDDTSKGLIGGKVVVSSHDPLGGRFVLRVPAEIQSVPGKYPVIVKNDAGASEPWILHVAGPILPRGVEIGRNTASTADEIIDVPFDGDDPTAARLRAPGGSWMDVRVEVKGKAARVVAPGALFANKPRLLSVELSNPTDTASINLPVSYVTKLDRPVPSPATPKPGGRF